MSFLVCQCTAVMVESPRNNCAANSRQCCQNLHGHTDDKKIELFPGSIQLTNLNEIDFMWKQENVCDFRCRRCGTVFRIEISEAKYNSRAEQNSHNHKNKSNSFNNNNNKDCDNENNMNNSVNGVFININNSNNNNSENGKIVGNRRKTTLQIIKKGHKILSCKNLTATQQPSLARAVPLPIREFFVVKKPHMSTSSSLISLTMSDSAEPVSSSPLSEWSNDTDFDMMFSVKRLDLVGSFNPISYMIDTF